MSWNSVVADRMRRHFGFKDFKKRSWNEAFGSANGADKSLPNSDELDKHSDEKRPNVTISDHLENKDIIKPVVLPKNGLLQHAMKPSVFNIPNFTKLELDEKRNDWDSEASKLTSEVAFWLRHLTIPMARTLTSSTTTAKESAVVKQVSKSISYSSTTDDDDDESDSGDNDSPLRWQGVDTLMVLYMEHQQGDLNILLCVIN